ncbi:MAG: PKD domain-containing protein, partial [Actinobacteria bacterium]|nr:PKD domain-containing protein [Actinomycetota bacterium]
MAKQTRGQVMILSKKIPKILISALIIISFLLTVIITDYGTGLFADTPKIKVFIDAGHGGSDPGAIGFGFYEKTANLDIALRVKSKLEAAGLAVVMRRTGDTGNSLDEIVNMANSSGADIFISIHNNASLSPYSHGTETYWSANGVAGSSQLAGLIQSYVISATGRANRGVKTANFRVIKNTTMPGALVECAFISNQTENALLQTADFREKLAIGIAGAVKKFSEGIIKVDSGGTTSGSTSGTQSGTNYSDVSTPNSSGFSIGFNTPPNGATVAGSFVLRGWSADLKKTTPKKLSIIEVYKGTEKTRQNLLGAITNFDTNVMGSTGILDGGWQLTISCDLLAEGENIIFVYAYDSDNNFSTGNIKMNVLKSGTVPENLNINPVAKPGGPYSGEINKDVSFSGSASYDPDGIITSYLWDFGDGTTSDVEKPVHAYSKAGNYTVTLTVKDNGNKQSAPVTTTALVTDPAAATTETTATQNSGSAQLENVSNNTSFVGYVDISEAALLKLFTDRNSTKLERAKRIAPLYIKYGKLFNLRADIAWAQMCHETGFLEFTGDVKPEQNNFAGIGATGGGVQGNSFATEELGVIAHYAHLAWYYFAGDVNEYCNKNYDPRHFGTGHSNYTGNTTLGFLNGRWAPGATYTDKIILFANQIIQAANSSGLTATTAPVVSVTANAGQDKSGNAGESLTFDASTSIIQASGDITISYSWDWNGDGTYDQTVNTAVVKHIFETAGVFDVILKITLPGDIQSTDKIKVIINSIPVADAGGPYSAKAGESITFDGSKSADSDGTINNYLWDFGDGTGGSTVKPSHAFQEPGTYIVKLTVVDDKGVSSTTVSVNAVITPSTDTSQTSETTAATTTTGSGGTNSSATTATGSSTETTATDTTGSTTTTTTGASSQSQTTTTKTTDTGTGATTTETTVPNNPPTANAGGPYSANAGEQITLDGSKSIDSDGEIKEYLWNFGDGSTATGQKPSHTYTSAGNYTAKLTVKDNLGTASPEATATVEIKQAQAQTQYPVNTTIITNSTSVVGYYEVTEEQLVSIFVKRGSTKVDWARRLAPLYIKYGKIFNIRADIAWAQMCHETGFLEFTGNVSSIQNNFAGLGSTGTGIAGNSFATEELGVIAHFAHLAWYYYSGHINQYCNSTYDPRH